MWTKENRRLYDRSGLRYESDLTDEEWAEIAPFIPPAKPGGNKRTVNLREVANGLMYRLSTGCQWRAIPKDLAARSTVHDYFDSWSWDGTLERSGYLKQPEPAVWRVSCSSPNARVHFSAPKTKRSCPRSRPLMPCISVSAAPRALAADNLIMLSSREVTQSKST
jgi:transposase